ncbi:LamG-like jellyroll fold domain-containing protein [Corynebacterium flavescens]|uniref:LamG-like jellyroll fold domain-containing protein n=1 Tax=Corynebacterium flavescens TaxID=28028 RepID=UPI003FCFAB41
MRIRSTRLSTALVVAGAMTASQVAMAGIAHGQEALQADLLDIEISESGAVDTARNVEAKVSGAPEFGIDAALEAPIATFDGQDDAVQFNIGDQDEALSDGFAVECTFKLNGEFASEKSLCANKEAGGFALALYDNELSFIINVGGGYKHARTAVDPNRWYHAVGVWNGNEAQLYLNGKLAATQAASGKYKLPTGNADSFTVGGDTNGQDRPQLLADASFRTARLYADPISQADVEALYGESGVNSDKKLELASTTPASGDRITEAVKLGVEYSDESLLSGQPTYELDGKPVELGQLIGTGLLEGEHEFLIEAKDVFGGKISERIPFTSGNIPEGAGTDTGQGEGKVTLSAIADNPSGGDVETTFTKGAATTPEGGFQGVVGSLPKSLEFEYEEGSDISSSLKPGDEEKTQTPSSQQLPFQRFDIALPADGSAKNQIVWKGQIDPKRTARLFAWNTATFTWDELASTRGKSNGDVSLNGDITAEHADGSHVHAMVLGYDSFADDIPNKVQDSFADRSEYDFAISHHTDTQYIVEGAVENATEEERKVWKQAYLDATQWVADNADARNIVYHAHTGDIIENWIRDTNDKDNAKKEFEVASEAQKILDDAEIVNGVLPGNHDNWSGQETGPDNLYNQYFGPERYEALEQTAGWQAREASHHPWKEDDNDNHYDLFTAEGLEFVVVSLGYDVTQEEADWADSVLKQYPDRNAIVLTHAYNKPSNASNGRGASASHDGSMVFDNVVAKNPNVALVLSGHEHGVSIVTRKDVGNEGNHVTELLADYQFYKVGSDELGLTEIGGYGTDTPLQFGAAFMRLLQFDLDAGEMIVDTYSPFLDNFGATEYDDRFRYDGTEDDTRLPVQFETRKTSFSTDAVTLVSDTGQEIGKSKARSGWPAEVTWSGLESGQVYAWYATSRDITTGEEVKPGETRQFAVFTAKDAGTDSQAPQLSVPSADLVVKAGSAPDLLAGVSATDNVDGDLTGSIEVVGNVDVDVPGNYIISYIVSDANGNQATANRIVVVEKASSSSSDGSSNGSSGGSSESSSGSSSSSNSSNGGILGFLNSLGRTFRNIFEAIAAFFRS